MADLCAIEVHASGLETSDGRVVATLYGPGDNVFDPHGKRQAAVAVDGPTITLRLADLACRPWAVIVYHDQNGNDTLDHRWGFPAEPLAFSNGFSLGLLSGLPSYDKLAIPVTATTVVDVVLK